MKKVSLDERESLCKSLAEEWASVFTDGGAAPDAVSPKTSEYWNTPANKNEAHSVGAIKSAALTHLHMI
jgi:hypothetical protein